MGRRAVLAVRLDGGAQDAERSSGGVTDGALHRMGPLGAVVTRLDVTTVDQRVDAAHRRTPTTWDGRSSMPRRNRTGPVAVSAAMDAVPRPARVVTGLLMLAIALAACAGDSLPPTTPSATPTLPPDAPVSAPPGDPSGDPSLEPPIGAKPVVPRPGQAINVHPVAAESLAARVDGSTIVVTAIWWSGVEPCTILDSIVVDTGDGRYTVTLREGNSPQEIACIAVAEQHKTEFEIPDVAPGTWTITDSGGTAPPVTVTVG
jgi:hypothetical protein